MQSATQIPSAADPPMPPVQTSPAPWHVRFNSGELVGPVTSDAIYTWLREKRLTADAWVWHDGWSDWRPAGAMFLQLRQEGAPFYPADARPLGLLPLVDDQAPAPVICVEEDELSGEYTPRVDPLRSGLATVILLATCAALTPLLGWVLLTQGAPTAPKTTAQSATMAAHEGQAEPRRSQTAAVKPHAHGAQASIKP